MIQNALPDLNEREREDICDRWIHITRKHKGGKRVLKVPTLENIEKLALYAEELQMNRHRVNFGKAMRARAAARRAKVHHVKGGYTAKMVSDFKADGVTPKKNPRKVGVQVGENVHHRGWIQRDIGRVKRGVIRAALLEANTEGNVVMSKKARAKLVFKQRAANFVRADRTMAFLTEAPAAGAVGMAP